MADIFISYANEDHELAAALAGKLASRGFTVWWDHHMVGGAEIRDVIHEQLQLARAAIVIWSENGVRSRWVKDEADEALRVDKLIPLKPEKLSIASLPLGHRGSHVIPLEEFDGILRAVRAMIGGKDKLTAETAIRKSGLAVAEATTLAWRYSYEYGLHIAICFIFVPIYIDLLTRAQRIVRFDHPIPGFNIWVQLGIFFGCLGWSSLISRALKRRYDSGIFLGIIGIMLITLMTYLLTPATPGWAYYSSNFLLGIQLFLGVGGALWLVFFLKNIGAYLKQ